MGFRYRKSVRLVPGVRLNITGKGLSSASFGKPGATLNMGRRGTHGTVGIPGSGLSYSSGGGKSALLPALIFAALFALFIYAARGSRATQVTLLLIGVGVVVLFLSGGHPHSGSADTKAIAVQTPTPAAETQPSSSPSAPVTATVTRQDQPVPTTNPAVPVVIETPASTQPVPVLEPASSVGIGPTVSSALPSSEPSFVVLKTANVRSGPSLSGTVVIQLPAGTLLSIVEISGHWAKVRRGDGVLGWINRTLLGGTRQIPPRTAYSQ